MVIETIVAALVGFGALYILLLPLGRMAGPTVVVYEPPEFEETPYGQTLLALQEIEFDRASGKLATDDYDALKARYTARALAALRAAEESP